SVWWRVPSHRAHPLSYAAERADPMGLGSGGRRWQPGRTHEGEDLVGTWKEQQAIANRWRREVVRIRAEGYRDDLVAIGRIETVHGVAADRPDEAVGDDRCASRAVVVG